MVATAKILTTAETLSKSNRKNFPTVLIADDDQQLAKALAQSLAAEGFYPVLANDGTAALELLRLHSADVALVDVCMPGIQGIALLRKMQELDTTLPIILMTGYATIATAVEAIQEGAHDFVEKPLRRASLLPRIQKALEQRKLTGEIHRLRDEIQQIKYPPIIGRSTAIRKVLQQIAAVAATPNTTVLIQGESGSGKELVARGIHDASARCKQPFIAVNCAALTASLLEAELFGYEKGAFTGALANGKQGLFAAAEGGTIFLDEISELALDLQAKLLRTLQERCIRRVGGETDIPINVRVIASTNRDLAQSVAQEKFRKDLFFRLHVMSIEVPTLRNRKEDIALLSHYFLETYNRELGKSIRGFSTEAIDGLQIYAWPGNVRELRNTIERAVILARGPLINKNDLHLCFSQSASASLPTEASTITDRSLRAMERTLIEKVIQDTHGNISRSAEILGINRTTLYNKLRVYEVSIK